MLCRTTLVVICVLSSAGNSIAAKQAAAEDSNKLSREVLAAMEGNQATLDSVRTMQATLTKDSSHSFPGKKGYSIEEKHKIIYDGDHFRKDQLGTRFRGEKEYRKYADALPVGQVDIDSAESNIDYIPPKNRVFVRPPEWSDRYKVRANDLLRYQSARGATLKDNILASARNGYYFTASHDTVDGEDCILLTCDYTHPESTLKVWVVPSKGYCIKKVQDGSKDKIDNEYKTTLKEYAPGIWWFDTAQARRSTRLETIVSRLTVDSLTLNESIDPETFTIWGLAITPQTRITDELQGTTYTLAIDDAKEEAASPTSRKILIPGLAILGLAAVTLIGIFIKGRKVRGEQQS